MICIRCGQEFDHLLKWLRDTNICGNCYDDLRQEEEAQREGAKLERQIRVGNILNSLDPEEQEELELELVLGYDPPDNEGDG